MNNTVQITTWTFLVDDTNVDYYQFLLLTERKLFALLAETSHMKHISTNAIIHQTLDLETRWLLEIYISFQLTDIKYPKYSSSPKTKIINKGKNINLATSLVHILPLVAVFLELRHPMYSHSVLCAARFICFLHVLPFTQCTFSAKKSLSVNVLQNSVI